jgi:tetratricopeptide (TPR) repeat protein
MSDELQNNNVTQPLRIGAEETQPMPSGETTAGTQPVNVAPAKPPKKPRKRGRGWFIFAGIIGILLITTLGGYLGYENALKMRSQQRSNNVALEAATQFQYGLDDMAAGRYEMARVRFEHIIELDPNFPGVKDKLVEVMIAMVPIPTMIPTITLTPTLAVSPTPDLRGEEELIKQIQQQLANKAWNDAVTTIELVRTKNLAYRTIDVDGFYYIALRNRGMDKILKGDLEGGMYDMALVERFGPLDRDADSYRMWARYYVIGASFWEVDWEKAAFYFGEVAPSLPMLRDSSMIPAIDRYRQAAAKYAEKLEASGDYCKANQLLNNVLINNYRNATLEPLATKVALECNPPDATATLTPKFTATQTLPPTATKPGASTATNTQPPTATSPGNPSSTVTPTSTATSPSSDSSPTAKPPTATPNPPTATPQPPTATPKPPTATPNPPTATPAPSNTPKV